MFRTCLCVAVTAALVPCAAAAADDEASVGIPITDPSVVPDVIGVGHDEDVTFAFNTPTILFVNFDGGMLNFGCGNDSRNNCSQLFGGMISPFPGDDVDRAAIMQAVREDLTEYGVIAVGERPPDGQSYAMVFVGLPNGQPPAGGVGGVAPTIDCGNTDPNITSFAFLVSSGSNTLATVIHQEAAHTWGLEHINDNTDNLHPIAGMTFDPKYRDSCSQVVSDTNLTPSSGRCNGVHTMFCSSGMQNSHQEMLALFGPPVADTVPPTVTIDNPADGSTLAYEDDFDLIITLDDDRRPGFLDTVIEFDGTELVTASYVFSTLTFPVNGGDAPAGHGLSGGDHTITVRVTDESGNPAEAQVTITIDNGPDGGDGADDGGDGGDDGADDGGTAGEDGGADGSGVGDRGCGCRNAGPAPAALLLLAFAGLVRRRRH